MLKILTGKQIKEADGYTIDHEPVESLQLMERAAEALAQSICMRVGQEMELFFFIGKGNNGGDGLAVARILSNAGFDCSVCMVFGTADLSEDCRANFDRLPSDIKVIDGDEIEINPSVVVIDAILGAGVSGDVKSPAKEFIRQINSLPNKVISIDLPSGMQTEYGNRERSIIEADITLTIEFPKLAMLLPEAGNYCGDIEVISIDLSEEYLTHAPSGFYYIEREDVAGLLKSRPKFSHKGDYGHTLLICGSTNMAGAAVLSTCAALRSGCGLVTTHIPSEERMAVYANAPSAMISADPSTHFSHLPEGIDKYSSVGIGPGLGTEEKTVEAMRQVLDGYHKPLVIDSDALNIIAEHINLKELVPVGSILTPHVGEFRRLAGEWGSEEEKIDKLRDLAAQLNSVVVLKGAHTAICTPDGDILFNSTGTPAMAKGGSGDILTGLLAGLLAQGYSSRNAAIIGVWLHGAAGEKAGDYHGADSMNSADIIDFISDAWKEIR